MQLFVGLATFSLYGLENPDKQFSNGRDPLSMGK